MLDSKRQEIAIRLDGGSDLRQVERDVIEPVSGLTEEDRDALWLFAWSYRDSRARPAPARDLREKTLV